MLSDSSKPDIITCPACGNEIEYQSTEEVRCSECRTSFVIQKLTDVETGESWYNLEQL